MVKIYKIVDPRDENIVRYVGKTITSLNKRMSSHIFYGIKKRKTPLYLWMNKVLNEGYKPLIILIEEVSDNDWVNREIFWIKHYRLLFKEKMLNISDGGESNLNVVPSIETRLKISISNKGKKCFWRGKELSEEHKKNISNGGKGLKRIIGTGEKISKSLTGKKLTDKHKEKIAEGHKKNEKSVLKICPITKKILEIYPSISKAIKDNGLEKSKTNLIGVCKGRNKTCGGYIWEYQNKELNSIKK